jgi:heme exporter protein A
MLEVSHLEAVRGDRRLFTELSFSMQAGELLYVNGPNGAGKSTLLRMLCGLVMPTAGEVLWNGATIRSLGDEYHKELLFHGHLSAIKAELSGLENLRISTALSGQEVTEADALGALDRMGLRGFEDLPAKVLSQGQKYRVALARLLLSKASLWILDEPFTALDKASVELLKSIFSGHLVNQGIIVLTTHQDVAIDAATVKQIKLGS